MGKKFTLRLPDDGEEVELELVPIKREDVPKPTKEDRELMILWSLRLFPFIINNYDMLFERKAEKV